MVVSEPAKSFTRGTHRSVAPADTLRALAPHLASFGITRVANVTGLDDIGIPTFQAVRPNARSLSVSQGKGLQVEAAKVSAIMEAVEQFHAERPQVALRLASYEELRARFAIADVARLPRYVRPFDRHATILWTEARELRTGDSALVPFDLVHLNLTVPLVSGSGFFPLGSNGLASGNTLCEATAHGLCELIERDAVALFYRRSIEDQSARRVLLDSVDDPSARELLERYRKACIDVAVWDVTSDVGVPTFYCAIFESRLDPFRRVGKATGYGCHLDRGVALCRALTEAAQSRLTRITGSRDDLQRNDLRNIRSERAIERQRAELAGYGPERRAFREAPSRFFASAEQDVAWLIERLAAVRCEHAYRVDLSRPEYPVHVVRVIVPGLEGASELPGYLPGERARALEPR
jgi:YcaO-like protein with predicted kinase domain